MDKFKITVVAGASGAGKTTWIRSQLYKTSQSKPNQDTPNQTTTSRAGNILLLTPGVGKTPIDSTHLACEFPQFKVFGDGQELDFIRSLGSADRAFIELGFYLELSAIAQILDKIPYRKVAVLKSQSSDLESNDTEYRNWADEVVKGVEIPSDSNHPSNQQEIQPTQLWRVNLTGQVLDEDSLQEFWYEASQGAYGNITRVKGIFDVADGRSLYGDFVYGVPNHLGGNNFPVNNFTELDVPRHLSGRPERFSGLEVVGNNFDEAGLKQTLSDCCLSDAMVGQYQQQVQEYLEEIGSRE